MNSCATEPLTIGIVDDHPLTRHALRGLVETQPGWSVAFECGLPSELLAALKTQVPSVLLIDLCYSEESGLDLLAELKDRHPGLRTLVYSASPEEAYAKRCFELGASGFVSKEEPITHVQEAIRCVMRGYGYVSERLTESVIRAAAERQRM